LIILIILGEEYKLWSPSLCSFLQPPVTSSLFGPNVLVSAQVDETIMADNVVAVRRCSVALCNRYTSATLNIQFMRCHKSWGLFFVCPAVDIVRT
jgi:hypothetical protein